MSSVMRPWGHGYFFDPVCKACGEENPIDGGWRIKCGSCGRQTISYVGRLGESQREIRQAGLDWDAGRFEEVPA